MKNEREIRVVGSASIEKKNAEREEVERSLFNHLDSLPPESRKEFNKYEYPKSEKELGILNYVNRLTSQLMEEAGVRPYEIPAENYHIIPPEFYKEVHGKGLAATFLRPHVIIFDAQHVRANPVAFAATAFHETLHLKAHLSLEVQNAGEETGGTNITTYRRGVCVAATQKHERHGRYHQHLQGLGEAIVAETEKRFLGELLDAPELAQEKARLTSDAGSALKKTLSKKEGAPEDDIIWVSEDGDNFVCVPYRPQREVLNYVCDEIHKDASEKYKNSSEVFKEFLKAHFTGELLTIARLVEKTFGEGSFRLLGNMGDEDGSGVLHLEALKKARARLLRKRGKEKATEQNKPA